MTANNCLSFRPPDPVMPSPSLSHTYRRRALLAIALFRWLSTSFGFVIVDSSSVRTPSCSKQTPFVLPCRTRPVRSRKRATARQRRQSRTSPVLSSSLSSSKAATTAANGEDNGEKEFEFVGRSMVTNETFEEQFAEVIPAWLLNKARECGWTHPTYAQQASLQSIFRDNCRNLLLQAETGSGKTLAYLLPCLSRIDPTRSSLQAVVVVPTRELGLQVAKVARRLASGYSDSASEIEDGPTEPSTKKSKILVMNVLQGSKNRRQRAWAWAEPPHVVIGTPPELLDMVAKGGFKRYNSVRTLIVDEVDACLLNNMGSVSVSSSSANYASSPGSGSIQLSGTTLHELLSKHLSPTYVDGATAGGVGVGADAIPGGASKRRPVERRRLTLFCSATIPQPRHFVKQCVQNQWMLQEPVHVRCHNDQQKYDEQQTLQSSTSSAPMLPSSLVHQYVVCADQDQKLLTLRRLLQRIHTSSTRSSSQGQGGVNSVEPKKKVLVFCDPRRPMKDMATIIGKDLDRAAAAAAAAASAEREVEKGGGHDPDAIVSVLSLEDSLTDRADAMAAFRGDDSSDPGQFGSSDHDGDDEDIDGDDHDDSDLTPGSSSPSWSSPQSYSNAQTRILLSSDLAARGLDIVDITHVVHYDLPVNADAYVHRSGRTGRFGRPGRVVSILPPDQEFVLQRLLNKLQIRATCVGRQGQRLQQHRDPPNRQ